MHVRLPLLVGAVALAFAAAGVAAAPVGAGSACGWSGYSYAGVESRGDVRGIATTLAAVDSPKVTHGHVGAWVGVGGAGFGPNHSDVWLQVGMSAFPDGRTELYYEFALPGADATYVALAPSVERGRRFRVAVTTVPGRPGWWRVSVDGRAASPAIHLPGSARGWPGVATAETWDGGVRTCNGFDYSFERVSVATRPGAWSELRTPVVFADPGYRLVRRAPASFLATGGSN